MTEAKKTEPAEDIREEVTPADIAAEKSGAEGTEKLEASAAEAAEAEDPVVQLEAEVAGLKDQLLRAVAETENVRRRGQREREDVARYAAVPLLRDLLGIADNLQRALESVPPESDNESEQVQNLITGVRMTERELLAVFERHNIEKIDPKGDPFDPHLHEAMFEVPDPELPAGTVTQVMQAGYRLHDRLLRPARVSVAKGAPAGNGGDPGSEPGSKVDTKV